MGTSQEVRAGDLVFCLFDVPETPRTVGLSSHNGMITGAYTVFECVGSATASFMELYYRAMDDRKLLSPLYSGLRNTIPPSRFLGTKTPVPPPEEQTAIVRFLDWVGRRIRRLIRARQERIELLEEYKHAFVECCFQEQTSRDWNRLPVCAVMRPAKRLGFPEKTLLSLFRDYGVIPKASRENKNVDVRDLAVCQLVKVGDVVMNKMKAWQGSIAVSELEGIVSPDYMVLEVIKDEVSGRFLHFLLRSPAMVAEYRKHSYGVRPGQWRLMLDEFRRLQLVIPSLEDQLRIAQRIDEAHARVEDATKALRQGVSILRELRNRLIADVVTGKLDVREAGAKLPDGPEDDEEDETLQALADSAVNELAEVDESSAPGEEVPW